MLYENLPGINVTLKDGGLIIPEAGGSESILIIAPCLAKDAPDEPVLVRSSTELIQYGFGDFYVNGEVNPIAAEWKSATDGGAKVVYLLPLKEIAKDRAAELEQAAIAAAVAKGQSQSTAQAKFTDVLKGSTATAALRRKFIYFYDVLMSDLLDFSVDHVVVKGVTVEDEVTSLDAAFFPEVPNIEEDFPFVGGMITSSYILKGQPVEFPLTITASTNDKLVIKVGGADVTVTLAAKTYNGVELGISDLASDLQSAINKSTPSLKANVRADNGKLVLYFAETAVVQAGTTVTGLGLTGSAVLGKTSFGLISKGSFAQTVADYCQTKTLMRDATVGYIGVKSPVDTKVSTIRKYVEDLMKLDTEISPYLQVIASEIGVIMPVTNSVHYINGATQYAALLSTLKKSSAPTNKPLKGVKAVRFTYSLRQLSRLTSKN
ncbi:phage tail sheath protein [Priestia megaterium]